MLVSELSTTCDEAAAERQECRSPTCYCQKARGAATRESERESPSKDERLETGGGSARGRRRV